MPPQTFATSENLTPFVLRGIKSVLKMFGKYSETVRKMFGRCLEDLSYLKID